MKAHKIYYSIPTDSGLVEAAFLPTLAEWCRKYNLVIQPEIHHQPLTSARNAALNRFISDPEGTHFLGMDEDIVPCKKALGLLLEANKPIIGGFMYATKPDSQGNPCPIPLLYKRCGNRIDYKKQITTELEEVDIFPGGFYLIQRHLIEEVGLPLFDYRFNMVGVKTMGSDVFASEKISRAGFKIYVHTKAFCDQMVRTGTMAFNNTLVRYIGESRKKKEKVPVEVK